MNYEEAFNILKSSSVSDLQGKAHELQARQWGCVLF